MIKTRRKQAAGRNDNESAAKTARLEARITAQLKALIERAAAYEGQTVTNFVVRAVSHAAKTIVQEHDVLWLNEAQSRAFVKELLEPSDPNARLRAAAKKYRRSVTVR